MNDLPTWAMILLELSYLSFWDGKRKNNEVLVPVAGLSGGSIG
jgi:hypothetical protein